MEGASWADIDWNAYEAEAEAAVAAIDKEESTEEPAGQGGEMRRPWA